LKEILGEDVELGVLLIDKGSAIGNAVKAVFPNWAALLCVWHANRFMSEKCKSYFTNEEFEEFMQG
jgi:hypothetical protein